MGRRDGGLVQRRASVWPARLIASSDPLVTIPDPREPVRAGWLGAEQRSDLTSQRVGASGTCPLVASWNQRSAASLRGHDGDAVSRSGVLDWGRSAAAAPGRSGRDTGRRCWALPGWQHVWKNGVGDRGAWSLGNVGASLLECWSCTRTRGADLVWLDRSRFVDCDEGVSSFGVDAQLLCSATDRRSGVAVTLCWHPSRHRASCSTLPSRTSSRA